MCAGGRCGDRRRLVARVVVVRPSAVPIVALVAAVLGGVSVLAIGKAAGWVGTTTSRTVVVSSPSPSASLPARAPLSRVGRPLAGSTFDPARIYAARSAGVVTVFAVFGDSDLGANAQGSGFVVSRRGHILTNAHVITNAGAAPGSEIEPAEEVYVQFSDRDRVPARIVGWDVFNDVGVIRVDPARHPLTTVPLGNSARTVVGEPVAAIGSPFGNEGSLSVGVVSAIGRSIPGLARGYTVAAIQTDAPINRGNSGGPLFDSRGRVIGINAQIRSESGTAEGVGFAIPINAAKRSLRQLVRSGRVVYPYVGISTENLTPSLARRFGYGASYGAVIVSVEEGSPGAKAGLRGGGDEEPFNGTSFVRGGDVVLAINGTPVRSADDVAAIVSERLEPGRVARFAILRGGQRRVVPVRLGERPLNREPSP